MGQYVTTLKGTVLYIQDTPGEKGTIIGVHGLTGNHKQLHHYQEYFLGEYRFISYDLRGRGNSDPAPAHSSIYTHAEDLLDLIATLGIERPILLGYSMGAYICSIAASRLPEVKALILLDGAGEADDETRELVLPSLGRLGKRYGSPNEYKEEAKRLYTGLGVDWGTYMEEVVLYEIREEAGVWRNKADAPTIIRDFDSFFTFRPESVFPQVACPCFLLTAAGSLGKGPLFKEKGYVRTKKLIPRIRTKVTTLNHYELVFNRQPDILYTIRQFLSSIQPAAGKHSE
ncbi:alpha/beta hydrolase [Siminovitchia sediminis]|uniref:Alpha/beta hydrolase n=1 Tax=Siminovitchia sediminis TaxID=1274353 RepID=A0ABW4KJ15_9BACI